MVLLDILFINLIRVFWKLEIIKANGISVLTVMVMVKEDFLKRFWLI